MRSLVTAMTVLLLAAQCAPGLAQSKEATAAAWKDRAELFNNICYAEASGAANTLGMLLEQWRRRYGDYYPFECPVTGDGPHRLYRACFGVCHGGDLAAGMLWPPPRCSGQRSTARNPCDDLYRYKCEGRQADKVLCPYADIVMQHSHCAEEYLRLRAHDYCRRTLEVLNDLTAK